MPGAIINLDSVSSYSWRKLEQHYRGKRHSLFGGALVHELGVGRVLGVFPHGSKLRDTLKENRSGHEKLMV